MGIALILIGVLAIIAGVVIFVWALVKKSGWGVVRSLAIGAVGLVLVSVGFGVIFKEETEKPEAITPVTTPSPKPTMTPNPPTAQEAIAMVRASPEMSSAVAPYKQELDWKAEWVEDRWWVIGLFESPWGVKFVSDATLWNGKVYAYIDYGTRPKGEWVRAKAKEWGLQSLYTRLTSAEALVRVKKSDSVEWAIRDAKIVEEVAELVEDTTLAVAWRFAFYVVRKDGSNAILAVEGYGGKGAKEGNYYGDEYGFGSATESYWEIPLHLVDWLRSLAKNRGWQNAINLP